MTIKTGHSRARAMVEARERAEDAAALGTFRCLEQLECTHCHRPALWYTGTAYAPALCAEHWTCLQLSRPLVHE
jgi:hypothetical protein